MATDKAGRGYCQTWNHRKRGKHPKDETCRNWLSTEPVAEASTAEQSPEPRLGICDVGPSSRTTPHIKYDVCENWREVGSVGESPAPATEACPECGGTMRGRAWVPDDHECWNKWHAERVAAPPEPATADDPKFTGREDAAESEQIRQQTSQGMAPSEVNVSESLLRNERPVIDPKMCNCAATPEGYLFCHGDECAYRKAVTAALVSTEGVETLTEETRRKLNALIPLCYEGDMSISDAVNRAYELGEKAGRSEKKEPKRLQREKNVDPRLGTCRASETPHKRDSMAHGNTGGFGCVLWKPLPNQQQTDGGQMAPIRSISGDGL